MTYEVVSILVFELFALFSHGRTDGRTERQNRVIEGAPLLKKYNPLYIVLLEKYSRKHVCDERYANISSIISESMKKFEINFDVECTVTVEFNLANNSYTI